MLGDGGTQWLCVLLILLIISKQCISKDFWGEKKYSMSWVHPNHLSRYRTLPVDLMRHIHVTQGLEMFPFSHFWHITFRWHCAACYMWSFSVPLSALQVWTLVKEDAVYLHRWAIWCHLLCAACCCSIFVIVVMPCPGSCPAYVCPVQRLIHCLFNLQLSESVSQKKNKQWWQQKPWILLSYPEAASTAIMSHRNSGAQSVHCLWDCLIYPPMISHSLETTWTHRSHHLSHFSQFSREQGDYTEHVYPWDWTLCQCRVEQTSCIGVSYEGHLLILQRLN